MITAFKVQGFKSLIDAHVELGLLNVFIGANGSGKSNLLEALGVIGAAAFGSVEPETLRYRGVRPGLPSLYKSSFAEERFRRFITLEASLDRTNPFPAGAATPTGGPSAAEETSSPTGAVYRLGLDNPITAPELKWRVMTESLSESDGRILTRNPRACKLYSKDGSAERITPPKHQTVVKLAMARRDDARCARELLTDLESYAIYSPTTPVLRGIAMDDVSDKAPLGLNGGGLPEAVKTLINRADGTFGGVDLDDIWELIEWADDMAAVPAPQASIAVKTTPVVLRFRDKFMRKERSTLSAYDASEGALYVLFALALLSHEQAPRVFAIDNFDHALHPRLASALTRLISKQLVADGTRQVLATTHSPLVLDGLDLRDDRIRLFAVDRNASGVTRVERVLVSEELLEESKKGLTLSRLWVMGRLGGVPRSL